jgi:hypothetical protein
VASSVAWRIRVPRPGDAGLTAGQLRGVEPPAKHRELGARGAGLDRGDERPERGRLTRLPRVGRPAARTGRQIGCVVGDRIGDGVHVVTERLGVVEGVCVRNWRDGAQPGSPGHQLVDHGGDAAASRLGDVLGDHGRVGVERE